jgi:hypothetical protein
MRFTRALRLPAGMSALSSRLRNSRLSARLCPVCRLVHISSSLNWPIKIRGGEAGRALSVLMTIFGNNYARNIIISCSTAKNDTAWTNDRFSWGHTAEFTVFSGAATWTTRPSHQPIHNGTIYGYPDFGQTFDYGQLESSYPVEELAGIIAHEMLHTHGYSRGAASNECNYSAGYNCSGSTSTSSRRANSRPEIVEACVSEMVERSIHECSWVYHPIRSLGGDNVPRRITPILYGFGTSECRGLANSIPKDGDGWLHRGLRKDAVHFIGADYFFQTKNSAADCSAGCAMYNRCRSMKFKQSTFGCWFKDSILPLFTTHRW